MRPPPKTSLSHAAEDLRFVGPLGRALARAFETSPDPGDEALAAAFHTYTGRMHPAVAGTLIDILRPGPTSFVYDPFVGSGTVPFEAMRRRLPSGGGDLNPIALLVTRERTRRRDAEGAARVVLAVDEIADRLATLRARKAPSPRSKRAHLSVLRRHYHPHIFAEAISWIDAVDALIDPEVAATLRVVFSSLVVKLSRRRSDSDARLKESAPPRGAVGRWMREKTRALTAAQLRFSTEAGSDIPDALIVGGDAWRPDPRLRERADIVVTSPPYPGTYDYHDHHRLRFLWLGLDGRAFEGAEWGSRRRAQSGGEGADDRHPLEPISRVLARGGTAFVVIGDWIERGRRIDAGALLAKDAARFGMSFVGAASTRRPGLWGEPRADEKREHIVAFER